MRVRTVLSTPKAGWEGVLKLGLPIDEGAVLCHTELPTDSDAVEGSGVGGAERCCSNGSDGWIAPPRLAMWAPRISPGDELFGSGQRRQ